MTDDDPPHNVIPFPNLIPHAVAQGLRDYYASLLTEPMPEDIAALCREFQKRALKAEEAQESQESEAEPDAGVA
jgi:hypothetical protein